MPRLIDADALKQKCMYIDDISGVTEDDIDDAPTIDAIPVEWLIEHDGEDIRDSCGNIYGKRKITVVEALSMWKKERRAR